MRASQGAAASGCAFSAAAEVGGGGGGGGNIGGTALLPPMVRAVLGSVAWLCNPQLAPCLLVRVVSTRDTNFDSRLAHSLAKLTAAAVLPPHRSCWGRAPWTARCVSGICGVSTAHR
jgi:hypothetical protein